jgi:hypothetical protein
VICFVELRLDGATRRVSQLEVGEQFEPLRSLAGRVLETAREAAREGVSASSLVEALQKLGGGTLAPETFALTLTRRTGADPSGPADGFLLVLEGRTAIARLYTHPTGYGGPTVLELPSGDVERLATALSEEVLAELPANLWDPHYADLFVSVLRFDRHVQARPFAGMTAATHGERQAAFGRILEQLEALARRVLLEGAPQREMES